MVKFLKKKKKKSSKGKGKLIVKEETTKVEPPQEQTNTTTTTPPPRKKKSRAPSKGTASIPRSVSKDYTPPLTSIAENHDEEGHVVVGTPATETSFLQSVNVVASNDESMEVVVGSAASTKATQPPTAMTSEPTVLLEQVHVFDSQNARQADTEVVVSGDKMQNHDDIRKALFQEEESTQEEEEESTQEEQVRAVVTPEEKPTVKRPVTPEEPPFDVQAEYEGVEDPAILDLLDSAKRGEDVEQEQTASAQNSITDKEPTVVPIIEDEAPQGMFQSDVRNVSVTKKLLEALACNIDTTQDVKDQSCMGMSAFYDTMCSEIRGKRPFFSEEFARDFMEDAVNEGVPLMFHYETEADGSPGAPPEWKGQQVTMFVRQGNYQGSQILHPRLEWPTPEQQWTTETPGTVNLMDIQSISDSSEDELRDDIEADTTELMDLCFFSITTKNGDVYMFESASPAERDWIVTGLKNVIVRLSYHLTIGDPAVSSELFSAEYDYGSTADLPTLKTPMQAMNEVAHAFLD